MLKMMMLFLTFLVAPKVSSNVQSTPVSPCPNVFTYEPPDMEPGRWYGVINLSTDSTLHSMWLNIILDTKADILGNWVGDVTTKDNIDFKIENTEMKIHPGEPVRVRFFVKYDDQKATPKLQAIRFQGKEICNVNTSQPSGKPSYQPLALSINDKLVRFSDDGSITITIPNSGFTDSIKNEPKISLLIAFLKALAIAPAVHNTPIATCPDVFMNDPSRRKSGRWYGAVNVSTDSAQESLWLNIVLDTKGNIHGSIPSQDKLDIKTDTNKMNNVLEPVVDVRFSGQYNHLNKTPKLQSIILNGREICNTINSVPALYRENNDSSVSNTKQHMQRTIPRPQSVDPDVKIRSLVWPSSITIPVTSNSGSKWFNHEIKILRNDEFLTEDTNSATLAIADPSNGRTNSGSSQQYRCGKVILNDPVQSEEVNTSPALEGQWPWQIAIYQTQTRVINNKYICGGTLVSHRHILTAAHCITLKGSRRAVNKNTLTVYLGKHNLRTSVDGVQIRFVERIIVHPDYNATILIQDLAILQLQKPATFSDWVLPACLWPDNQTGLSVIVGKTGSVVGWGFEDTGVAAEELNLVEMFVVKQETCLRSDVKYLRFTSEFTYCAGVRNGTSLCIEDSGGGMVFNLDGAWHVRGLISNTPFITPVNKNRCEGSHYTIFTDLAKFLPWIRQYVDYEDF